MNRLAIAVGAGFALLAGSVLAAGEGPTPAELVEKLGSPDFREREDAGHQLDRLGPAALDALRAGCRSEDPEVARRAGELVGRIGRRLDNEKALAPTLVTLDAEDAAPADVLDHLSKQSGYRVVLGGTAARERVSVRTGKVPFWEAVLKVCEAADLQVASAGGFYAPGSSHGPLAAGPGRPTPAPPWLGAQPVPVPALPGQLAPRAMTPPTAPQLTPASSTVVLEPRPEKAPRRPAAVYGAVLVEAFPVPGPAAVSDVSVALLQAWPEPKLNWQQTKGVKVTRATDPAGRTLAAEPDLAQPPQVVTARGAVVVRQVNGNVVLLNPGATHPVPSVPSFTPNARQAVVKFRTADRPAAALREFAGSLIAVVRSTPEPLASVELVAGQTAVAEGPAGVELRAARTEGDFSGRPALSMDLAYDVAAAAPVGPSDALPGGRPGANHTVYGLRVTDAEGRPFQVALSRVGNTFDPTGRQARLFLRLTLVPGAAGQGDPKTVTFWGTHAKPVEVPFRLSDVPAVGKR